MVGRAGVDETAEYHMPGIRISFNVLKRNIAATVRENSHLEDREIRSLIYQCHSDQLIALVDTVENLYRRKILSVKNALELTRSFGSIFVRGQGKNRDNKINPISYFYGDDWHRYKKFFTVEQCIAIATIEADKPMVFKYEDKKYQAAELVEVLKATGNDDLIYEFQLSVIFGTKFISGINAG